MSVPAGGVLLIAAGGVLAYAGFTGMNPLAAVRDVMSGKPSGVRDEPLPKDTDFLESFGSDMGDAARRNLDGILRTAIGSGVSSLPAALTRFRDDRYSQLRRWQDGYSDCSSFIGKGLKVIGIKPPGYSTTFDYMRSSQWRRVSSADAKPGDLVCNWSHIICYVGNGQAVGQQNPRSNVKVGSVASLMAGTGGSYVFLRYNNGDRGGTVSV